MTRYYYCMFFFFLALSLNGQPIDSLRGNLDEVQVFPPVNPALRIMQKGVENKTRNAPYSRSTFSYVSYQKFFVTSTLPTEDSLSMKMIPDTTLQGNDSDSLKRKMQEMLSKQHLFLSESVSEKYYKKPAKEYEKVIASRTSGMKDPIFSILLSQIQTGSIYKNDVIDILKTDYLNPLSEGALNKYQFILQETIPRESDTLFVIDFFPDKRMIFNALKGSLTITSDHYAVQQMTISPADTTGFFKATFTCYYEKQADSSWFLSRTLANVILPALKLGEAPLLVISEVYTSDIAINIPLKNSMFGIDEVETAISSYATNENYLQKYRHAPLSFKEQTTYQKLDTIGEKYNVDRKIFFLKTLSFGAITFGPVDLDVLSIIDFNNYEGWRFGARIGTNKRFLKFLSLTGHFAYGIKDKAWKWGGSAEFIINRSRNFVVQLDYYSDLVESGRGLFFDRNRTLFEGEFYRKWLIHKFDRSDALVLSGQSKINRFLSISLSTAYARNQTCFEYNYQSPISVSSENNHYNYTDFNVNIGVRIAFREKQYSANEFVFFENSKFPVFSLFYSRGIKNVFNSSFNYNKIDLKIYHKQQYRILGFTEFTLMAGIVESTLPFSLLFVPRAGYAVFGIDGKEQFGAMRADEFLSNAYTSLYIRHNFGKIFRNNKFSPRFAICQNIGLGWLKNREDHHGVEFQSMEKGYFETGLIIEDLLVIKKLLSFGLGVYYRYGYYAFEKEIDNFAFKLRFRVPLL